MQKQSIYSYDAYISYSSADRLWVESALLPRLYTASLRVDVSDSAEVLDTKARTEIARRVGQAHYVILVLSPDSLTDRQVEYECDLALERNFREKVFCLLPVQIASLDEYQIPKQLALLTIVDFTQPDKYDDSFARLLWVWQKSI